MLLENSGEITPEIRKRWSLSKNNTAVDVTGDGSKVQCCKEKYCIGVWNVRSMNQGKLEVVRQEMARVDINILETDELKWTAMGKLNLDDYYIYYWGEESLRSNRVALTVYKSLKFSTWVQSHKQQIDLGPFPRQNL